MSTCYPRHWLFVSYIGTHQYVRSLLRLRTTGLYHLSEYVRIAACVTLARPGSGRSVWQDVANGYRQVNPSGRTRLLQVESHWSDSVVAGRVPLVGLGCCRSSPTGRSRLLQVESHWSDSVVAGRVPLVRSWGLPRTKGVARALHKH